MVLQGSFPNQEKLLTTGRSTLHKLLNQLVGWRILSEASSPNLITKETSEFPD